MQTDTARTDNAQTPLPFKESIWIRKEPNSMKTDGGVYSLPTAYDRLLVTCSTSRDHKPDEARRWRAKRRN